MMFRSPIFSLILINRGHGNKVEHRSVRKVSEPYFFDIVTTQNDHPNYVKHVLGSIHVFYTLFRYWVQGGGFSQGIGAQPAY